MDIKATVTSWMMLQQYSVKLLLLLLFTFHGFVYVSDEIFPTLLLLLGFTFSYNVKVIEIVSSV